MGGTGGDGGRGGGQNEEGRIGNHQLCFCFVVVVAVGF